MAAPYAGHVKVTVFVMVCLVMVCAFVPRAVAASCESLANLKLQDTTLAAAMTVASGDFVPPSLPGAAVTPRPIQTPSFCRVLLTVAPKIKIEVWLPISGWNGNFEGVGGGGFAGVIVYAAMATALRAGYATASTDTGHEGNDASFALLHPDLVIDFAYRGIHEMTVKGKQVVEAFYGTSPREAYFSGCSQGGRQALTEAQRYPEDYNGIVAGAPAINNTGLMVTHLAVALATLKDEGSYIPPTKLPAIQQASVAACDRLDGLKDGLLDDPRKCNFDPAVLLCKGAESTTCLTAKQVAALRKVYAGVYDAHGALVYPGHMPGVEAGWTNFTTGSAPYKGNHYLYGLSYMRNFIFADPNWDFRTWDFATDMQRIEKRNLSSIMDSTSPDLRPFRARGGKLIMYQGWGDDDVSPLNTIGYYKNVVATISADSKAVKPSNKAGKYATDYAYTPETAAFDSAAAKTTPFARLFMVAGMNHCGGGTGPNIFDSVDALAQWVANQHAPDKIVASHYDKGVVDRTRPLCPYPMTAQYTGKGSIDEAANFVCKAPQRE